MTLPHAHTGTEVSAQPDTKLGMNGMSKLMCHAAEWKGLAHAKGQAAGLDAGGK